MHEYGLVQDLVKRIVSQIPAGDARRVTEVRVRRGSTMAEEPLRQAFEILSEGTPLQGAALRVEEVTVHALCNHCGRTHVIRADDLIGHLFVCPECGAAREIDEAHGLELQDVLLVPE
jgi:hydrogenase nickel incorporation protein HypA/HybF